MRDMYEYKGRDVDAQSKVLVHLSNFTKSLVTSPDFAFGVMFDQVEDIGLFWSVYKRRVLFERSLSWQPHPTTVAPPGWTFPGTAPHL